MTNAPAPVPSPPAAAPARSVLAMIGNTPMIEATKLDAGPCRLFLKLENQNPAGSIKDRIGLSMIEAAERDGRLKPGGTIVEATAGNTGLGLALVAGQKGYRLVLVIPDKMSQEKVQHVRALGAEVRMTRSDVGKGHPEYYQDMAQTIAQQRACEVFVALPGERGVKANLKHFVNAQRLQRARGNTRVFPGFGSPWPCPKSR